ncbi:MAG TPA: hypothetical protein ENJ56_00985 [Anaerolineae bacterium]|nr:hypothetical protein [Anaerolineae bacterium]
MYHIEHFKTEFVRVSHAKIMGRGRLSLTLYQLLMTVIGTLVFSMVLRLLPLSNWFAVLGGLLGVWLGSERAGALQVLRFVMPVYTELRVLVGRQRIVDIAAEWEQLQNDKDI